MKIIYLSFSIRIDKLDIGYAHERLNKKQNGNFMLTFFRRIKKGFLDGGKTSIYLVYAIGEIALVVIRIFIALLINNWNKYRMDKITERKILLELSKNLNYS